MVSLDIKVPEDLPSLLRMSRRELEREVQAWVALELFRDRRISAGKAAEIADVSLAEFMALTIQHSIPWVDYTQDELERELRESIALGDAARPSEG